MRVTTFGEVMLRLTTPRRERFNQARALEMTFGGAEANVAVSLAILGDEATFVTRLPKNDIAEACIQELRGLGVNTRAILRGGDRIGVYYLEAGASQRGTTVTYDRAGSAITTLDPSEIDWPALLAGNDWFHFTGITPALSDAAAQATRDALKAARALGVTVSCDLNYRKKLWSPAQAQATMSQLMPMVDYCIANEEDAEKVFGIKAEGAEIEQGRIDHDRYIEVAAALTKKFGLKGVAIALRESFSASRNGWSGLFYKDGQACFSRRYEIDVVDRVGAGDAFGAGFIHSSGLKRTPQQIVEFAAAASCLKHSIFGDYNRVGRSEIEALLGGDGSGRVQR
ncbi:sugar kinase [Paludisphaera borealis]|uniref:2-dehydro-3-deoxygluconokinase n=1 Tax=Paludisphaera borealis TaxID=1387353 RepID=A0A1U7CNW3_9BACT|nr:sugar kinase [Paludisphaera borealis]APW60611.1 2-dehydro-3-deoxygluconokinase [Paludisphaera borealis]